MTTTKYYYYCLEKCIKNVMENIEKVGFPQGHTQLIGYRIRTFLSIEVLIKPSTSNLDI